jgi:hypothetical protein
VAADPGFDPGRLRSALHHRKGVHPVQRPIRQDLGPAVWA